MKLKYWLIYSSFYNNITKGFETEESMDKFIEKYKGDIEVIARTKIIEGEVE